MYQSRLGSVDDLVVAVVGDTDVSVIEGLARHYIGTLPAGEADTYVNSRPPMPTGLVQRQVKVGEGESAVLEHLPRGRHRGHPAESGGGRRALNRR